MIPSKTLECYFNDAIVAIKKNRPVIHQILGSVSTYKAISEEIDASILALEGGAKEILRENPTPIEKMAIYHSSNVILYSFVLYGILPSVYCKEIIIRPSTQVQKETLAIAALLEKELTLPIRVLPISQRKFTEKAKNAEVVVFTGKYENSVHLRTQLPDALFLFFGSGSNPVILSKGLHLEETVASLVQGRMLNSGQDCLCSDVIFVHQDLLTSVLDELKKQVKKLRFGWNDEASADYGPLYYEGVVKKIKQYWESFKAYCIYSNRLSPEENIVDPIIFSSTMEDGLPIVEFFGPVFNVVSYTDEKQIEHWLLQPDQLRSAMGLSVFGNYQLSSIMHRYYNVHQGKTCLEAELGNEPFGGFGVEASYVCFDGKVNSRPILISREVANHFSQKRNVEVA